jgi:hypothetical protein
MSATLRNCAADAIEVPPNFTTFTAMPLPPAWLLP